MVRRQPCLAAADLVDRTVADHGDIEAIGGVGVVEVDDTTGAELQAAYIEDAGAHRRLPLGATDIEHTTGGGDGRHVDGADAARNGYLATIADGKRAGPCTCARAEAPKNWPDLLDSRWANSIMVKMSTTFTQRSFWNEMRKLYGDDYWTEFSKLQPVAYDSMVQQNDRLVNEQDMIAACAQDSGYLDFKRRGAPINFVIPTDGLVGAPVSWGIVKDGPNPEAAKLYLDFLLSAYGQAKNVEALLKVPTRTDVAGPVGVVTDDSKILYSPKEARSLENRAAYQAAWDAMVGMP